MAMYFYYLTCCVNGKKICRKKFLDKSKAFDLAKKLVVRGAKKLGIEQYISGIREGVNLKYRNIVADYLETFFASDKFEALEDDFPYMSDADGYLEEMYADECAKDEDFELPSDPLDDFCICNGDGIKEVYFNTAEKLYIGLDIPETYEMDNFEEMSVRMKDSKHEVQVIVKCKTIDWYVEKPSNSANILLVYRALTKYPQTREEIRQKIRRLSKTDISLKTIGKHINTLRKIGVPISYAGLNKYMDYDYNTAIGFYEDENAELTEIDRSVLSELGTRANPMLVLFTLKNANREMKQAEIIDAIEQTYGVKIARAAVGRHIKMLQQLEYNIEKTSSGFLMKNI